MSVIKTESYHDLAFKVVNVLVSGVRSTVEYSTHGVLSVLNAGRKKQVPPAENRLLYLSASTLAEKIRKQEVTCQEVVRAYIDRIAEVNDLINAVVDERYKEAMQDAQSVDLFLSSRVITEEEISQKFPLLGVPFTSKEAVLVKGLSCTGGLVCRKGMKALADSEAVESLKKCGAIPLAVTNTSEICMWWETYNNVYGRTNNPYDTTKTVGGSSGGEAALIAAAGSVIGIGTDLGGSIRIPAFFTGIYGHKPTQGIVPNGGQYPPALKEVSQYAVVGPMTRYASDLKLVLSAMIGKETSEKIQLLNPVDIHSVKVYYMLDDGGSPATSVSPEIKNAIQNVADLLSADGLSVEKVQLDSLKYGFFIWCSYLSQVKDQRILDIMQGEVKAEGQHKEQAGKELLRWLAGKSEYTFPIILNACCQDLLAPLFQKNLHSFIQLGERLKASFLEMLGEGPSVFLFPTFPSPACHHGQIQANPFNAVYSVVFNGLGLPATQCPLGLAASGMPLGMQIVTAPHQDRVSIQMAEYLEHRMGGWMPPTF